MRIALQKLAKPLCDRHALSRRQAFWLAVYSSMASTLLTYFYDPRLGRGRRAMLRDRGVARIRRMGRDLRGLWRGAAAEAYGASHRVVHRTPHDDVAADDDETLRQRVESQLFRDRDIARAGMNITAEHGTITLRGELGAIDDITYLEDRVRRMPGVRGVRNLLHPRGTAAPNKERSRMAMAGAPR